MSGAGKSILTAGILRVLRQDGYRVAPFKSQNMALNSFVTADGREIGRAQVLQAKAAGREPSSDMNPILLKPMGDTTSQVIVNGLPVGNMRAREYFQKKKSFLPDIVAAYERLSEESDVVVIEGAGSPVEINLRENDIVNMGLAEVLDAPVLLVGDIDPGGVFAQLLGTYELLSESERDRIKGLIINKFRGDVSLLEPGLDMFRAYCSVPFAGVVPFTPLDLDEEDSVSKRLQIKRNLLCSGDDIKITVVRFPFISNYTDFTIFEGVEGVSLFYVDDPKALDGADLIILPGTKNTVADLDWIKRRGFASKITELAEKGALIIGICGGFQMLGRGIWDPEGVESGGGAEDLGRCVRDSFVSESGRAAEGLGRNIKDQYGSGAGGAIEGLGLLPVDTVFGMDKKLRQIKTNAGDLSGVYEPLSHAEISGYEIHMGVSTDNAIDRNTGKISGYEIHTGMSTDDGIEMSVISRGTVLGTYIHGIFDSPDFTGKLLKITYDRKGLDKDIPVIEPAAVHEERELNRLADVLRGALDWELIYRVIGL